MTCESQRCVLLFFLIDWPGDTLTQAWFVYLQNKFFTFVQTIILMWEMCSKTRNVSVFFISAFFISCLFPLLLSKQVFQARLCLGAPACLQYGPERGFQELDHWSAVCWHPLSQLSGLHIQSLRQTLGCKQFQQNYLNRPGILFTTSLNLERCFHGPGIFTFKSKLRLLFSLN